MKRPLVFGRAARAGLAILAAAILAPATFGLLAQGNADAARIASAVLPLPAPLRAGATVLSHQPDGTYAVLHAGSNNMVCIADVPGSARFQVSCYDRQFFAVMQRHAELLRNGGASANAEAVDEILKGEIQSGKLPLPAHPTLGFRMAGAWSGYDPSTNTVNDTEIASWQMVIMPYMTGADLSLPEKKTAGLPYVMDAGTWTAHIMVEQPVLELAPTYSLAWFDRTGKRLGEVGKPNELGPVRLSPDGNHAAVLIEDAVVNGNGGIWIYDLAGNQARRITDAALSTDFPIWSPDGSGIVFTTNGNREIDRTVFAGGTKPESLYTDEKGKEPTSLSPDGKFLLYNTSTVSDGMWVLPLTGDRKPSQYLKAGLHGQFSPDGRWVAYQSGGGIYVAPFPGPGERTLVSTAPGVLPQWRADGKELFYVGVDQRLMAAEIGLDAGAVHVGAVRPLFGPIFTGLGYRFDVSPDGQRILAIAAQPNAQTALHP